MPANEIARDDQDLPDRPRRLTLPQALPPRSQPPGRGRGDVFTLPEPYSERRPERPAGTGIGRTKIGHRLLLFSHSWP